MICKICGKEVGDGALYCDGCGSPIGEAAGQPLPAVQETGQPEPTADETPVGVLDDVPQGGAQEETVTPPAPEQTDIPDRPVTAREAPAPQGPPKIHSHMVLAIVMTVIFGNWILGIPAIVFARECELAAEKEQWDIARRFSGKALAFALIGVAVNLALWAFIALVVVVLAAAGPSILYW